VTISVPPILSIAQTRQRLSGLIAAAQQQPQVISKLGKPVAVLVSADYFARSEATLKPPAERFFSQVLQLREAFPPPDESGFGGPDPCASPSGWQRTDTFADPA
jgi:prevent-host-death family protein